jgi:chemotaxis protein methyltransferase CheR
MLLCEHFPDLVAWNLHLVGTDLSEEVLTKAREGKFSQIEVNRGLSAGMMVKYFDRLGMTWQLRPQYRSMARFTKLNLIDPWPSMPQMDVVFLRNVLIYFSPATKKEILNKVRQTMAPNSVLFLGAAETTMGLNTSFERVENENSVYYRIK